VLRGLAIGAGLAGAALAGAALAAPSDPPAPPAQDPAPPVWLKPVFGNTIVSSFADGRTTRLWMEPDGRFEGQRANGKRISGRWSIKGEKVCFRQLRPVHLPVNFCQPRPEPRVGAAWPGRAPWGEPVQNKLVPGQQGR
jgi:hypothetical protein